MEDFVPLSPVNFFQMQVDCYYAEKGVQGAQKYVLPDLSALCGDYPFARVSLGWNNEGIEAYVLVDQPCQRCSFPNVTHGDSVELFFDTRDVKTASFNTRFCHHFFFLPEAIEGQMAGEITRFRTEDTHELCDAKELRVKPSFKKSSYSMQIFIPSQCLYGYDPEQFDRLGFTYRINRPNSSSQHFSVVSADYQIDQQPSLWSSLRLVK